MPCKRYDYKLAYVQYYLLEDKMQEEVCKIFFKIRITNSKYIVFCLDPFLDDFNVTCCKIVIESCKTEKTRFLHLG